MEDQQVEHGRRDDALFSKMEEQLASWRGAIKILAFALVVFGGVLLDHVLRHWK